MPTASPSGVAIRHLAFLTPGNYADDDPAAGLEASLKLFELGEELGFDSAWVRQRHLERGVSSAPTFLAAASQRTRRIGLGTAVIQIGYENVFRLAEDLANRGCIKTLRAGFDDPIPKQSGWRIRGGACGEREIKIVGRQ